MNNYTFEANYWGDFEWGNVPPHDGHPIELTKEKLDAWIGKEGLQQLPDNLKYLKKVKIFCFNYLLAYFNSYGVRIEKAEEVMSKSFENELVEDILSLMASFSAKIYGRRSSQNRKKKEKELSE
jgi:hypothetical protein